MRALLVGEIGKVRLRYPVRVFLGLADLLDANERAQLRLLDAVAMLSGQCVVRKDQSYIARWPEVEAWAEGKSPREALANLGDSVASLQYDLEATPDEQLGRLPLRWKRLLRDFVAEEAKKR